MHEIPFLLIFVKIFWQKTPENGQFTSVFRHRVATPLFDMDHDSWMWNTGNTQTSTYFTTYYNYLYIKYVKTKFGK